MPTAVLALNNDGQGDGHMVAVPCHNVPGIGVAHVAQNNFLDIDTRLLAFRGGGRLRQEGEQGDDG